MWIASDDPKALGDLGETEGPLVAVCHQPPADRSILDVAARDSHEWLVLATLREMDHLRQTATAAGWDLKAAPPSRSAKVQRGLRGVIRQLRERMDQGGLEPYALLVEEVLQDRDAAEIAAAALALWNEQRSDAVAPAEEKRPAPGARSWARLFFTVGSKDGVRPGDLLGAVTGEASVPAETVGKINVRETHSIVEVESRVADQVIRAVNGTTIRARSVRVDYDRPAQKRSPGRSGR